MLIIILFILILNVVSILLMYRSLNNRNSKEKLIFIAMGIALMYILTSVVYWISTRNIEMTEVSDLGKDLIIFLFVPINGIIVLPLFARTYCKFKDGGISGTILKNRGIVLGIVLLILLIVECSYFENIKNQIVRHEEPYITLANDVLFLPYCAICWAKEKKLYQMKKGSRYGITTLSCYNCHSMCHTEVP